MKNYLISTAGRGAELARFLMEELGIPETAISFSVHFPVDGLVSVTCEFAALEKNPSSKLPEHPCG